MLIENLTSAPWGIGHSNPELGYDKNNKWKPGQKVSAEVTICVPGVNRLDDKLWSSIKNNPDVINRINAKKIAVIRDKPLDLKKANDLGAHPDLAEFNEKECIQIIEKTLSKNLLEDWIREDSRPKIQRVINLQLDKLKIKR